MLKANGVAEVEVNLDRDSARAFKRFCLDRGPLVLGRPAQPRRNLEALGEEAGLWGNVEDGFEAWVYPFKLFDGLTLLVSHDGGETFLPLERLARYQWATPHMAQLRLATDRFALTQTFFVPRRLPGLIVLLDIDAPVQLAVAVRLRPCLAPMLMSVEEEVQPRWDPEHREVVFLEKERGVELRVTSPFGVSHRSLLKGTEELRLTVPPEAAQKQFIPILFTVSWPGGPSATTTIANLSAHLEDLLNESLDHYTGLLARAPQVTSPDAEVNDALAWSVVSLDQLRVRNPYLGYGLVSGYSSSGQGTRPQYAWFFDEPTLSSWAFHRVGLSGHVREAFRFLQRFQRGDGKTVHEVPQSLHFQPRFLEESPYAYIHTDGPVYFLAAYGHYYRSTGDLGFICEQWPKILRTFEWCLSVVDRSDGLIQVQPRDWGSAESSFSVWKDTQLEGMWVQALSEMAYLAGVLGDAALAARCAALADKARESIETKLWNEKGSCYYWGLDRSGRPLESLVPHNAISIWMGNFRADRAELVLEKMASSDFRTDWGVRSLSLADPAYNAAAYQTGSVWPVWNTGVIVGDYRHHRSVEGFRNWRAMVRLRTLEGLGPMPEVLHGRYYKRLKQGVPHQMFSELAVQSGFYDGLLGLELDVPGGRVKLAPRLPPIWDELEVNRIPFGPGSLNLSICKTQRYYELAVNLDFPREATMVLEPSLPAGSQVLGVTLDGKAHDFEARRTDRSVGVRVEIPKSQGNHVLRITHRAGVGFLPVDERIEPGGTSRNLRIIRATFIDSQWRLTLEGLPDRTYPIDFFTERKPSGIPETDYFEVKDGSLASPCRRRQTLSEWPQASSGGGRRSDGNTETEEGVAHIKPGATRVCQQRSKLREDS